MKWRALLLISTLPLQALAVVDVSTSEIDRLPKAPTDLQVVGKVAKPTAGDIVELTIRPPTEDSTAQPAMVEELKNEPYKWGDGRILWWKAADPETGDIKVGLTTYKPGVFAIAPIPFIKDGKAIFASQPLSVEFSSVGQKGEDEIYPPVAVGFPQWVWVILGLFALALVLGAIWWLKRWSDKRRAAIEEVARAPKILTPIEEFEKLRAEVDQKKYVERATFKPHYFALSDASKRFLGKAFKFDAEERTTRELVRELESLGLSDELIDKWEKVFEEMDVTKFTDQVPEQNAALSLSARLSQLAAMTYRVSPVARQAVVLPEVKK